MMSGQQAFLQVCGFISPSIRMLLQKIPDGVKEGVREIRLRVNRPVVLFTGNETYLLRQNGSLSQCGREGCYLVAPRELEECFKLICEYSVHSYQEEIRQGFVTLRGGHRVGLCGTGIVEKGTVSGMKEISSMNIRIAHQVTGVADELIRQLFLNGVHSVLIIGETGSGKTTLLRDLIRQLSDGKAGYPVKVAVIDERGELGAVWRGIPQNDLGLNSDIYHLYPKPKGMGLALRTLSPQVIACDEIGSEDDIDGILLSMNAGVCVIATAHGDSLEVVSRRKNISALLESRAFEWAVVLEGNRFPCQVKEFRAL